MIADYDMLAGPLLMLGIALVVETILFLRLPDDYQIIQSKKADYFLYGGDGLTILCLLAVGVHSFRTADNAFLIFLMMCLIFAVYCANWQTGYHNLLISAKNVRAGYLKKRNIIILIAASWLLIITHCLLLSFS